MEPEMKQLSRAGRYRHRRGFLQAGIGAAVLALALASYPTRLQAADLNWFAEFSVFQGCSTNASHTNWVDFTGLHHLLFINDPGGLADPDRETFILSKSWDCSSVDFWEHFRKGTTFAQVTIEGVEPGVPERLRQKFVFEMAKVESLETAFESGSALPTERIRLLYTKITMESYCFDTGGASCGVTTFCYDFTINQEC